MVLKIIIACVIIYVVAFAILIIKDANPRKKNYYYDIQEYDFPANGSYYNNRYSISANVSESFHHQVSSYAKKHKKTVSEVVRSAVTQYMKDHP